MPWSDHFLPVALRGEGDLLRRARLTVRLSMVLVGAAFSYALFYATVVHFFAGAAILAAGAGVALIALLLLRRRRWHRGVGHALTLVLYAVLVALACVEGGLSSLATPWLMTPPIFAILLLGRRGAAGWTVLCVATVVAFQVAESRGVVFPVVYPAEWAARLTLGSHAGLVVCTAILLFVFEDVRASAQAMAESASTALEHLAYHDALTGLANRARFLDRLDRALADAVAAGNPTRVAVLLLDLDGFKAVNDTQGHGAGDLLLSEVAGRLLNATRGCDTVARFGGDEFAVLIGGVRKDADAGVVAQRIVNAVAAPFPIGEHTVSIGASVGVARAGELPVAAPCPGQPLPLQRGAAVLHHADVAMYRAKALGRGRWLWYEDHEPSGSGGVPTAVPTGDHPRVSRRIGAA